MKKIILFLLFWITLSAHSDKLQYPYKHISENVTVYSDISSEFSILHAKNALAVWKYFKKIFKFSPGNRIELYYTRNVQVFKNELRKHPAIMISGGRQLTTYWNIDHRKWFIIPYKTPDFETQIHEISHDFLYFTFPKSEEYPWFKEGSGMYWESGKFNSAGELIIESPLKSYLELFNKWKNKGELIPLKKLVSLKRLDFYAADFTKTYSQAMMFFYYLMKKHVEVMKKLFNKLNQREITNNQKLIDFIVIQTNETLDMLERNYMKFTR